MLMRAQASRPPASAFFMILCRMHSSMLVYLFLLQLELVMAVLIVRVFTVERFALAGPYAHAYGSCNRDSDQEKKCQVG